MKELNPKQINDDKFHYCTTAWNLEVVQYRSSLLRYQVRHSGVQQYPSQYTKQKEIFWRYLTSTIMTPSSPDPSDDSPKQELDSIGDYLPSHIYCHCGNATLCNKCGKPMSDRDATKRAVEALCVKTRPAPASVFGNGPLLLSDIPESAIRNASNSTFDPVVVLGIDEAGRGSVLGPMVYGAAYWSTVAESNNKIPKDFNDSKQLTEKDRDRLFDAILCNSEIGFAVRSILPSEISRNMLREYPYNLNQMSHDSAMTLIRKILDQGVQVQTAYIDTVGNPAAYQRKLDREFPGINFVVESKADAKYASCSAASVGECLHFQRTARKSRSLQDFVYCYKGSC
jgi:ribonuclease H